MFLDDDDHKELLSSLADLFDSISSEFFSGQYWQDRNTEHAAHEQDPAQLRSQHVIQNPSDRSEG